MLVERQLILMELCDMSLEQRPILIWSRLRIFYVKLIEVVLIFMLHIELLLIIYFILAAASAAALYLANPPGLGAF